MTGEPQTVDALLEQAVAHHASDLHLTVGAPPAVRVRGELRPLDGCPPLDRDGIFIVAAYAAVTIGVLGLIVYAALDARRVKSRLATLDAQGVRRRSDQQTASSP